MFKYCRVALSSNLKRTIFPSSEIGSDVIGGILSAAGLFFFYKRIKSSLSTLFYFRISLPERLDFQFVTGHFIVYVCVCVEFAAITVTCFGFAARDLTAPAGSATTTSDADDACLSRRPQGPPHTFTTLTDAGSHLGNRLPAFQVTRQVVITTTASRFLQRDEYGNYDCVDEGNRARILKYSQRGLKRREKD